MFNRKDKHMPVAVVSGSRGSENRTHHLVDIVVVYNHVDLKLRGRLEAVLMTQPEHRAVGLRRVIVFFANAQTVDPDAVERLFDLVQFAWPDEAADQLHGPPPRLQAPAVATQGRPIWGGI